MSTPISCFPSAQEFLLIPHRKVACFADSFFRRLSSPIVQVSLIFVSGMLESSCGCVSDDKNVGGCVLDVLGLGGGFLFFPSPVGSCAFLPFYQSGITTWN